MSKFWNRFLAFAFVSQSLFVSGQVTSKRVEKKGEFTGLAHFGLCTSQINGDGFGGFNKFGLNTGVGVFTPINSRFKFQFELNYAERGSRKRPRDSSSKTSSVQFYLHYIDIPLLLKLYAGKFEVEFGICNGIYLWHRELATYNFKAPSYANSASFNRYECAANIGLYVPLNDKWNANARFHYSIYPASGGIVTTNGSTYISGWYNNAITFGLYRLFRGQN